jgi:hypothetical protein
MRTNEKFAVRPYFFACKNKECSAADNVVQGQCKSFKNGIWRIRRTVPFEHSILGTDRPLPRRAVCA